MGNACMANMAEMSYQTVRFACLRKSLQFRLMLVRSRGKYVQHPYCLGQGSRVLLVFQSWNNCCSPRCELLQALLQREQQPGENLGPHHAERECTVGFVDGYYAGHKINRLFRCSVKDLLLAASLP